MPPGRRPTPRLRTASPWPAAMPADLAGKLTKSEYDLIEFLANLRTR
jgi:hypothetical protein